MKRRINNTYFNTNIKNPNTDGVINNTNALDEGVNGDIAQRKE